jgi:hypothetical protein
LATAAELDPAAKIKEQDGLIQAKNHSRAEGIGAIARLKFGWLPASASASTANHRPLARAVYFPQMPFPRILVIFAVSCALACAQGTNPKPAAPDYAAHAELNNAVIGAENLGHSLLTATGAILVRDFLIVEVALYPKDPRMKIRMEQFHLRVNGKKGTLLPQSLGMVISSLKYPDWSSHPTAEVGASLGNAGVILGRPVPVERFPGDNRPAEQRGPAPPRAPDDNNGVAKSAPEPVEDVINHLALPEGDDVHSPASGYLFFPFQGQLKSIKTLDLIYEGPLGTATLRLP